MVVPKVDKEMEDKLYGTYNISTSTDAPYCEIDMTYSLRPGIYPADLYKDYQLTTDRIIRSVGLEVRIDRPGKANTILSSAKEN